MCCQCAFCCVSFGVLLTYHQTPRIHLIPTHHFADREVKSSWGNDKIGAHTWDGGFQPELSPAARTRTRVEWGMSPGALWAGQGTPAGLAFQLGSEIKLRFSDVTSHISSLLRPHTQGRNVLYRQTRPSLGCAPNLKACHSRLQRGDIPSLGPSCNPAAWAHVSSTRLCFLRSTCKPHSQRRPLLALHRPLRFSEPWHNCHEHSFDQWGNRGSALEI